MSSGGRGFNYSSLNYPNYNAIMTTPMAAPPPPMQQNQQSYAPQSNANSGGGFSNSEYSNSGYSNSNFAGSGGGYSGGSGGGYSGGSGGGYSGGGYSGGGYSGSNSGYGGLGSSGSGGGYTNRSQLFNSGSLGPPDPVSKAVYHNMDSGSFSNFSKYPKKRPKPSSAIKTTCNVCALTFNSQDQLQAHIRGSKHAKKIQSTTILGGMKGEAKLKDKLNLQKGTNVQNSSDKTEKTAGSFLSCQVCNVTVNSPMQMEAHNIGGKHKNKVQLASGEKKIKLSKDSKPSATSTPNSKPAAPVPAATTSTTSTTTTTTPAPTAAITPTLTPIARTNGTDKLDEKKKKTPPPPKVPKPIVTLTCEICGISVNSDVQLTQHKTSKKHLDKLSGKTSKSKPFLSGANKVATNFQFKPAAKKAAGQGKNYPLMSSAMLPLSQSFVKKDLVYF